MYAHIGNPRPIEAVIDRRTGETKWRRLPPEATTKFLFPEGTSVEEAVLIVIDALPHHMEMQDEHGKDIRPAWVETDDKNLTRRLCVQYDIPTTKNKRPANWGQKEAVSAPGESEG